MSIESLISASPPDNVRFFLELLVLGSASWRMAHLIMLGRGPFNVLLWLRTQLGIEHDDGTPTVYPDNFFGNLLQCSYCTTIWTSALCFALWYVLPFGWIIIAITVIATLALLVELIIHWRD